MTDEAIHGAHTPGRGYCGTKTKSTATDWARVTCDMCHAAHRADQEAT